VFSITVFFGVKEYKAQFIKLQKLRTFPIGEISENTNKLPINPHVIMLGDSRLSMWDTGYNSSSYLRFSESFTLPVKNMAIGGTTSSQTLLRVKSLPWSNSLRHTAIIQSGINDIHWLGVEDKPTQKLIIAQLKKNLLEMVSYLEYHNQKVIIMTLFPPGKVPLVRRMFWAQKSMEWIEDINQYIHQLSSSNVIVWDVSNILSTQGGYLSPKYIDPDFFLHINKRAYKKLSENLP